MYACRAQAITAIAVSDTTHADPFTLLLSKLSPEKDAAKINDTKVDRAHSIISGVDEMLRNKCSNATWLDPQLSDAKEKDDGKSSSKDLCVSLINDAFSILFELEPLCKDDNALKEKLKSVISKGVAVLSMHKVR
ncbi:hypothetical protein TL16_g06208 [Triparma laevis f. inornata]|uniref:Uncharacterized protein n=1 Tax=Triparma laevis f. inornata TaxID=1714386 RepID=A0A9W7AM02_9STRA|nr:hypothetical protein TL16_g06208 [Triparma laevis f. inornata]